MGVSLVALVEEGGMAKGRKGTVPQDKRYSGNEGRGIEGGVCGDGKVGGNSGVNMARRVNVERLVEVEVRNSEERKRS